MPTIIFVEANGNRRPVDAHPGESGMQAAVRAGIGGIVGECGGSCMCATCHVHVDPAWVEMTGEAGEIERETLEFVASSVGSTSRLACQIAMANNLDGLVLHVATGLG
jgi:ferredoxin, 2Fe-2S